MIESPISKWPDHIIYRRYSSPLGGVACGSFGSFIISWLDWVVGIGIEILCLSLESVTYNPRISLHWSVVLSSYNWLTCIPKTVITQNDLFNSITTRVGQMIRSSQMIDWHRSNKCRSSSVLSFGALMKFYQYIIFLQSRRASSTRRPL